MKRYFPFLIIGAVLITAIVAAASLFRSSQSKSSTAGAPPTPAPSPAAAPNASASNTVTPNATTSAATTIDTPNVRGGKNAPVTLEEFGDYQCPPCGMIHPELEKIESEFGDKVRLVFRHLPLVNIHRHALLAAHAAEAAGLQGRFWQMHDRLYEKQREWSASPDARQTFIGYARELGLDTDRFTRDLDSTAVSMRVINDTRRANSMNLTGTPTLFVNGRMVPPEMMTADGIRQAVRGALGSPAK